MKKNLKPLKFIGLVTALLFFIGSAVAQELQINGHVKDTYGEPLPGVTAVIKGTQTGTITNIDGYYNMSASKGDVLVFSFIGMKSQEVKIGASTTVNVVLEDEAMDIEEVQVVAYGTQKKMTITGAISSISADELVKSPNASVANTLAGKITGLATVQTSGQPGADDPEIYIRGMGTFNDASPIFIVDGVEREFSQLDPEEIDNITVLKDASATAVYGIRGANGVIIVTTKRGTTGKTSISVSASTGIQQPTRMLDYADSYTYVSLYTEAERNDGTPEDKLSFSEDVREAFRTKSDPIMFPDMDWMDYVLKPQAYQAKGNINITGGTDKVKYFLAMGVLSQDGLFETIGTRYDYNFSYKRYNYRSNLDIKLTNTTDLGITIGGRIGVKNEPETKTGVDKLFGDINTSPPFSGAGIVDGKWVKTDANESPLPFTGKDGFEWFYGRGHNNQVKNTLNFDIDLKQDLSSLTKGLKFRLKFAYNTTYTHSKTRSTSAAEYKSFYRAHLDPDSPFYTLYAEIPDDRTIVYKRTTEEGILGYKEGESGERNWYTDFGFNYNRKFGSHNVSGLLLYNQRKVYYPKEYKDIPTGVVGGVGRVTYDYKTKYLAEFNMGYNGSENFAREQRYGWFPAGSLGWVMSEESFMKNIGFINYLKVRGSYGIVGNDKYKDNRFAYLPDPYSLYNGSYYFGDYDTNNKQSTSSEKRVGNPYITWETAHKRNIGIDTWFFDSRLAVNVDVFREDRDDILIVRKTLPSIYAIPTSDTPVNMGRMKNEGYEIEIKWKDNIGNLKYWISTNMSYARNKILEMDENTYAEPYMQHTGHPKGTPFGYVSDGFFTQDIIDAGEYPIHADLPEPHPGDLMYKDLNKDGFVNSNDVTAIGYPKVPEYVFGLNMGANYKGFDFTMAWAGATNVERELGSVFRDAFGSNDDESLFQYMVDERWTPETAETATYPRMTLLYDKNNTLNSDFWLRDASYLRLKNVELGYTFKKSFLSKLGVKNLRVYANGSNLLLFDHLKITDPESNTDKTTKYPLMKIYNIGLKAGF